MPHVKMHGYIFHWTQAVWRKIANLALSESYNKKETIKYWFWHCHFTYRTHSPCIYWIEMSCCISCFATALYIHRKYMAAWKIGNQENGQHTCVHLGLTIIWKAGMDVLAVYAYVLVKKLYDKVRYLMTQLKLLSYGRLERKQRSSKLMQFILLKLWDDCKIWAVSTSHLLKVMSNLNSQ